MSKKKPTKEEIEAQAMKKVRRARVAMASRFPFFGQLVFGSNVYIDDTLNPPTAATDGVDLYYHPEFVLSLTDEEAIFVTGHEGLHMAFMHLDRRGDRDPMLWNVAADIVCNQLLYDNSVGQMPKNLIFDPRLYKLGGGIVTKIYDLLDKNDPRKSFDDFKPRSGKKPAPNPVKMQGRLQQAIQAGKQAGNLSGSLEAFVKQLTEAKVRWEDEIFSEITSTNGDDRTYARRNRRYAAHDLIIPAREGTTTGDLVYAIDCSGSTSNQMVAQCGAEVRRAKEQLRPERTFVIYWDTEIKKVEVFGPDDEMEIKAYGRGGTSVGCVWDYIRDNDIQPQTCVVATDLLFGGDFGREVPDYPVIWCVMDNPHSNQAPFGRVINTGMVTGEHDFDDEFDDDGDWD